MAQDRAELGAFLRSRRDRLTPAQAGIEPFPGARRVPGLRKEELAVLAGLSPDYYSRLEQGRQPNISTAVLDGLARALRLTEVEHAHLVDLAEPTARRRATTVMPVQRADPGLLRLMSALDHLPVLLLGQRTDVLASNALFSAVQRELPPGSSLARFLFLDPLARERIVNWPYFASNTVATLRREVARRPQDGKLKALIDELRAADPDVTRWWDDHQVRDHASVRKLISHPIGGELEFDIEIVSAPRDPDQQLIVYTVQPDSPTAKVLPLLASWHRDARVP
ncbi:helix-turn-helix transcriptional regulator [Umezawaea endophytica]|uniref:Helix-turn-helix transcriptional regulator n=1 Tax=Umezawaea endophytica TaxID=1654476 RepID=A0A9X2VQ03_9PSEU|nr:helix-turn-helix transcriptional regulator [Umezawaea endophytica]MCS7480685.1 helix-turn-helix transcriptional regulator [Umezawaea endophytica]